MPTSSFCKSNWDEDRIYWTFLVKLIEADTWHINEREHDTNLARFKELADKYNLTLNKSKCVYRVTKINLLGYDVNKEIIRPNSERQPSARIPSITKYKSSECLPATVVRSVIVHTRRYQGGDKERIWSKEMNDKQQGLEIRRYIHECNKKVLQIEESPFACGFCLCCGCTCPDKQ